MATLSFHSPQNLNAPMQTSALSLCSLPPSRLRGGDNSLSLLNTRSSRFRAVKCSSFSTPRFGNSPGSYINILTLAHTQTHMCYVCPDFFIKECMDKLCNFIEWYDGFICAADQSVKFKEAAENGNLIPLHRSIFADHLTPVLAYRCLVKEDDRDAPSFLFECVDPGTSSVVSPFIFNV